MSIRYDLKNNKDIQTYIVFNPNAFYQENLDDIKLILENDNNIHILNELDSYKIITDLIYRNITETQNFCSDTLNPLSVKESFKYEQAVVIIGSSLNNLPSGNIYSFSTLDFDQDANLIDITTFCSHKYIKGAGYMLMNALEVISRKLFLTKIQTTSVTEAITFYEKYGFVKDVPSCTQMCLMTKPIKSSGGKKRTKTIKRKAIKKKTIKRKAIKRKTIKRKTIKRKHNKT